MKNVDTVTILIIDDKPGNIYALTQLLEKPGRVFLNATNGKDGLKLALLKNVDLIILDVQMPEMDGFEVAQILKSNKKTKDIPIIFATAEKKEHQSMMKGFEEGAVDYLFKPLDPEITKAKVSVLLKIQRQKKELIEKNRSLEAAKEQIKQLNSELKKNLQQLEITNKELEAFSYSVSHDLRSPLRLLHGYAKILEEDYGNQFDDEAKGLVDVIQRNVLKMDILIQDLLAFARLGKQEIRKLEINTEKQVQGVIAEISNSIKHKTLIKMDPLLPVRGDYTLLGQVWTNLLSNAIKYSAKKEKPEVEIGSSKQTDEIVYYVKDNGAGFNMKYSEKLFGVFQRLHKDSDFQGTGVGLAIVQRIITRHGGRVWAEAKENEGATFYFSLPC